MDEAREAGIEHMIFVTGRNKAVIEDHFDKQYELEETLRKRGKTRSNLNLLERDLPMAGQTSFTRQQEPLGPWPCRLVRARIGRQRTFRPCSCRTC